VYNQPIADSSLVGCPNCDLLQRLPQLAPGESARCPRCDEELCRRHQNALERTTALAFAAAVLYVIANTSPMLRLAVVGRFNSSTVLGGVEHLIADSRGLVAGLVLFAAVIAPALQIISLLAIAIGARRPRPARWVGTMMRLNPVMRLWSMLEVMLVGVLVALVKIADYATVTPGIALYVLGALVFVLTAMQVSFDPAEVWSRIEWAAEAPHAVGAGEEAAQAEV
jgi:paraquat-inducible protein A